MEELDNIKMWGIHTLVQEEYLFLNESTLAVDWTAMGDLNELEKTKDAFTAKYLEVFPDAKKKSASMNASTLYRFMYEMKIGDYVVFPAKSDRTINIGVVEGDYYFEKDAESFAQRRKVKWLKHLPRTMFSQEALYEVGAFLSVFEVGKNKLEFLRAINKDFTTETTKDEDVTIVGVDETIENTKDFILRELSHELKGYDMELFVANLLEAMGYRTSVSPHGGDGGIDIVAYKDEFPPRILVQVKSTDGDISGATIQSLRGAMREGDYGVFVTLSNYTKKGKEYLENTPIIRGINGGELADLVLKYYDKLDEKYKDLIPLSTVYVPAVKE